MAGGFAGAGRVGSEDEASDVEQRRADIGFTLEHVQGGAADLAGAKCCDQRGFVDDATAGGVDQVCGGFHGAQGSGIDQVVSLGVSGVWTVTTSLSASRVGVSTKVSPTSCNAPPTAKLASRGVVRAVAVDEVARMLQRCDRRTGTGRRDVAILTVLARLGSRRGEVAALSVDDINWHTGELVVTGKGSRRELAAGRRGRGDRRLLSCGRRNGGCRTLFVSSLAPWDGLSPSGIGQVVARGPDVTAAEGIASLT
jgi:hypothetical protein